MTKEQFMHQKFNWSDKNYDYAIHITDGGAKYLYQHDKDFGDNYDTYNILRLDGLDITLLKEDL